MTYSKEPIIVPWGTEGADPQSGLFVGEGSQNVAFGDGDLQGRTFRADPDMGLLRDASEAMMVEQLKMMENMTNISVSIFTWSLLFY